MLPRHRAAFGSRRETAAAATVGRPSPGAVLVRRRRGRARARGALWLTALLLAAGGAAAGCGGGAGGSTGPGGAVADVAVDPPALTLMVGKTSRLGAIAHDGAGAIVRGRPVFWDSSDSSVAKVDQDGVVAAQRAGAVRIAASVDGKAGFADVTVTPGGPASVVVDPPSATVLVGQSATFKATVRDASGEVLAGDVAWASDNSAVARVSAAGVVTGVSPGSATISATREGARGTAAVTVQLVPVSRVVVSPAAATVKRNNTRQLAATAYDASNNALAGRTVQWTSSDASIAKVSATGLVTALRVGSATITATVDGKSGTAAITVN